eukprot:2709618-Rhodomonas_salina.3
MLRLDVPVLLGRRRRELRCASTTPASVSGTDVAAAPAQEKNGTLGAAETGAASAVRLAQAAALLCHPTRTPRGVPD